MRAAQVARPDLDDATEFYEHYWDNDGEPREWDYEEAYSEDSGIFPVHPAPGAPPVKASPPGRTTLCG